MRVRTETSDLTRLTRLGFVNAYLVREDDGLTLVDTMLGGSAGGILDAAKAAGQPVARIVLTHAHGDHAGSLDALAAELPSAEVIMSEREAPLLAHDLRLAPGEPESKLRGSWPKGIVTRPTRVVNDGDRIGSLRVIAAPGHTPGHIALLDERHGTLICGDAYSTLNGVSTTGRTYLPFPLAAMATWHRPTENRSAAALRALDPSALAPGHGPVVTEPGPAMDRALRAVRDA